MYFNKEKVPFCFESLLSHISYLLSLDMKMDVQIYYARMFQIAALCVN